MKEKTRVENRKRAIKYYKSRMQEGLCGRCGKYKLATKTRCRKCLSEVKEIRRKLKIEVIDAYGGKCLCCGLTILEFLTIEHTRRDGSQHRKKCGNGSEFYRFLKNSRFPKNLGLTILCMNCNFAKRFGDKCPHEKSK